MHVLRWQEASSCEVRPGSPQWYRQAGVVGPVVAGWTGQADSHLPQASWNPYLTPTPCLVSLHWGCVTLSGLQHRLGTFCNTSSYSQLGFPGLGFPSPGSWSAPTPGLLVGRLSPPSSFFNFLCWPRGSVKGSLGQVTAFVSQASRKPQEIPQRVQNSQGGRIPSSLPIYVLGRKQVPLTSTDHSPGNYTPWKKNSWVSHQRHKQ